VVCFLAEGRHEVDSAALTIYLGVFAALVAAGVGFPMPEEIPIVTAGALAGHASQDPASSLHWWILLPLCILGVVISDGLLYLAGRTFGMGLLRFPLVARILPRERVQRVQRNFRKYGVLILLFARVLPGIRSPIFLTAGIMRLSWRRFLLADGIYAIPGVSLLFFLAYWFTDQFRDLVTEAEVEVSRVRPLVILAGILGVAVYCLVKFLRHPVHTGDPQELPLIGDQVAATMQGPSDEDEPADLETPEQETAGWRLGPYDTAGSARPEPSSRHS
jgi:membrane protein DedA with SNARE-associated domain